MRAPDEPPSPGWPTDCLKDSRSRWTLGLSLILGVVQGGNSMRPGTLTLFVAACLSLPCGIVYGDGDDGERSSRLTPPDGAPFPDARGEVELGHTSLKVEVEGLGAGDYQVLLDDGTGTKKPIGTITVKAEESDDEEDDS